MDYMKFVSHHRSNNADITIGCIAYGDDRAKEFGLMKIDSNNRILVREPAACVKCVEWSHGRRIAFRYSVAARLNCLLCKG